MNRCAVALPLVDPIPRADIAMIYPVAKRLFDLVLASAALVTVSPVLLGVALWIKLDSPGPVIYTGRRIGRGGRPFGMHKFRTMVLNADALGGSSTPDDDPRLTRSGKLLRRYKLDELPQLFNVVRGDMSFVG